jgi:competence protein ComEA
MRGGFGMSKVRTVVFGTVLIVFTLCLGAYAAHGVINVNSANKEQLMMLPGIGEKTAKNILAYRQGNGSFKSLDVLTKVKGISRKKLDKLRPSLALEGPNTYIPVDSPKAPGKTPPKMKQ